MDSMLLESIIILVLILINGLFAMSEIAVVSARKARLQQAADEGDARAGAALELAITSSGFPGDGPDRDFAGWHPGGRLRRRDDRRASRKRPGHDTDPGAL